MPRPSPLSSALILLLLLAPAATSQPAAVDEPVDLVMVSAIREEGLERSEVMDTLWHLTDLYGPRLTNSPQQRRAAEWARDRLAGYGLENCALEAWGEFGLGWSVQRCVVELTEPDYMPLIAVPQAWTAGTGGVVSGVPLLLSIESEADLEPLRGTLAGRIVLRGAVRDVGSPFEPLARRHDEAALADLARAEEPSGGGGGGRRAEWRARRELNARIAAFFAEEGVAAVIEPDAGRRNDYGVIMLGAGGSHDPAEPRALCQVTVSAEQFNRVARLIGRGHEPVLRVEVATTFHGDDPLAYDVVGEIPGSDPALGGQVVMIGAHFDSWHPGTGATDNGASSAVMIEAARILMAVDARPRRTVRVALWTGEEQGLLGSKGYVKRHFGDPETMELRPEHGQLAAYFNLDNGAGRIRGVYMQGNAAVRPIFEAWLAPFADLGAATLTMRDTGGTDHLSFDALGLPGFQFIQDPLDYGSRSHHTNMDLYERVIPGDVMQAATVIASFAYHAAMREQPLPRKPLPEPPPGGGDDA